MVKKVIDMIDHRMSCDCEMSDNKMIYNEQIKARALYINNIATAFVTVGYLTPAIGILHFLCQNHFSIKLVDLRDLAFVVLVMVYCIIVSRSCHRRSLKILKKLKP